MLIISVYNLQPIQGKAPVDTHKMSEDNNTITKLMFLAKETKEEKKTKILLLYAYESQVFPKEEKVMNAFKVLYSRAR